MNPDMASVNGYSVQQGHMPASQIPLQQIPSPQQAPQASFQSYNAPVMGGFRNDYLQGQGHVYQQSTPGLGQYNMDTHVNSNGSGTGNGTLVSMIEQMNNNFSLRLSNIESSLTKLTTIELEVAFVRSDVYQLQRDNTNISTRMSEVEKSCQMITSCFDESKILQTNLQKEISDLKNQNSLLADKIKGNVTSNETLSNELSELRARSMQQNLLFFGIGEPAKGDKEYIEPKIKDFMKHELDLEDPSIVDSIVFDRIHRIGRPNYTPGANPRPVVARFERYKDREVIREAAKNLNAKRNGYSIREQYPPEMEAKRRVLYPVMRQMQQNPPNRVALVRDKLFVNNDSYTVRANETGELTLKFEKQTEGAAGQGQYSNRRILRGVRNQGTPQPQGPSQFMPQGNIPFRSQLYSAAPRDRSQGQYSHSSQFESHNMYRVLDSVDEDSTVTNGKHQASSPAFDDRTQKKTREQTETEIMEHGEILDLDEGTVASSTLHEHTDSGALSDAAGKQPVDRATVYPATTQTVTVNTQIATDRSTSSTDNMTLNDSMNSVSHETAI